jgi:hypothetical protein
MASTGIHCHGGADFGRAIRALPGSGKIDINGRSFEDYFLTGHATECGVATAANGKARECI